MKATRRRTRIRALGAGVLLMALAYGVFAWRGTEAPAQTTRAATANTSPFNADRAFADLKTMVAFGPRPAGSEALAKTRAYIVQELQKAGLKVTLDEFEALTQRGRKKMNNIRATRRGTRQDIIALVGHNARKQCT